jgi:hypothetical protein
MPTVIDSLVVTLGLDASKFTEQQKKAVDSLRTFQESANKSTKPVQKGMDDLVGTFKEMQGRLLAIGAIIATGLGFNRLVQDVTKLNLELGKTSLQLGLSAKEISAWEHVGRVIGASTGEMTGALALVNEQIQHLKKYGWAPMRTMMGQVQAEQLTPKDTGESGFLKWADWASKHPDKQYAASVMREQGFTSNQVAAALQGRKAIEKELEFGRRFAPTTDDIKKFTELNKAFGELLTVIERLTTKAILPFVAALTKILQMLTDWLGKWAENNQTPAEAAGEGFGKMGMPELKQNQSKPGLFQRGWNWLKGNSSGGAQGSGGDGQSGANDNAPTASGGAGTGTGSGGAVAGAGSRASPGGSPDSAQPTGALSSTLAQQRAGFERELRENPALRDKVMRIAANEQGRNPHGTQAVLESMMNRAIVRGTNLETQARWFRGERRGYYAMGNMGRGALEHPAHRQILEHGLANALGGSNISNYATDNSSGSLAARERASGSFRFRSGYTGETFFAPGTAEPGLAQRYDQWHRSTTAAEAAAGAATREDDRPRSRVIITKPEDIGGGQTGNQRSFENWRNLGLGAKGAAIGGGDRSSIDNSQSSSTHIQSLNVTTPPGASASAYADGIQRRLGDYNNVQNSNTGMV